MLVGGDHIGFAEDNGNANIWPNKARLVIVRWFVAGFNNGFA